ncbi:MAG: M24 family metallopeptidase [Tepidisphaeraceae bacterium]|jgi:Xaa-Pro aminopeptidase
MALPELENKNKRLLDLLDRLHLDGVLLSERANFRWISGGRDNGQTLAWPWTAASILFTRAERLCLASSLATARMEAEEMMGMGWKTVSYPWDNQAAAQKMAREIIGSRRIAADVDIFGLNLPPLPSGFGELKLVLTEGEIIRYREGAKRTTAAVQAAARELRPGQTEHDIAGVVEHHLHRQGVTPIRVWVTADDRAGRFGCVPPTELKAMQCVVIAASADYRGLVCTMTRMVHFGPPSADFRKRYQAVSNLDAALILSTRTGRSLAEFGGIIQQVCTQEGYPNFANAFHPGGISGYGVCALSAGPEAAWVLRENQSIAWTPALPGARTGDTILLSAKGPEPLTQIQGDWPKLVGHHGGQTMPRPDVLVI